MKTRGRARKVQAVARKSYRKKRRWLANRISTTPGSITISKGRIVLLIPRRLKSPNSAGGWRTQHHDRMGWEQLLRDTLRRLVTDGSITLPVTTRMRLTIQRLAPSKRFLLDFDNANFSAKRFCDALTATGFLVDDNSVWLDGPHIVQGVSSDGCYWCIAKLVEADPFDHDIHVSLTNPHEARADLLAFTKKAA